MNNSRPLKFKYDFIGFICVMISLGFSAYPVWEISMYLAEILNIPANVPVKEQKNGLLWLFSFLTAGVVILVLFYSLIGAFIAKIKGWSKEKYINVFFKNKYPEHWYK